MKSAVRNFKRYGWIPETPPCIAWCGVINGTVDMLEKRSVERFDLDLKAYVSVSANGDQSAARNGQTRDVSTNGVFLLLDDPLPVGTKVKVEIVLTLDEFKKLGGKALIKTSGKVLRAESQGMAVSFDSGSRILPFSPKK